MQENAAGIPIISSYVRRKSHLLFYDDEHVIGIVAIVGGGGRGVGVADAAVVFFRNRSD